MLYKLTDARSARMIERGLIGETASLIESGHSCSLPPMQSIGYAQCAQMLEGRLAYENLLSEIQKATRHLAKRQETWFKRNKNIHRFNCAEQQFKEIRGYIISELKNKRLHNCGVENK
jgi:tRNA dimethylallyltransferase